MYTQSRNLGHRFALVNYRPIPRSSCAQGRGITPPGKLSPKQIPGSLKNWNRSRWGPEWVSEERGTEFCSCWAAHGNAFSRPLQPLGHLSHKHHKPKPGKRWSGHGLEDEDIKQDRKYGDMVLEWKLDLEVPHYYVVDFDVSCSSYPQSVNSSCPTLSWTFPCECGPWTSRISCFYASVSPWQEMISADCLVQDQIEQDANEFKLCWPEELPTASCCDRRARFVHTSWLTTKGYFENLWQHLFRWGHISYLHLHLQVLEQSFLPMHNYL